MASRGAANRQHVQFAVCSVRAQNSSQDSWVGAMELEGAVDNEAALVRLFYDDLRAGRDGLTLAQFLRPLYFLQHATFTLVDAKSVFDLVKGKGKAEAMSLREYATALAKVAKIRYASPPRTLARLLADMGAWRAKAAAVSLDADDLLASATSGYDTLRLQMLTPGVVEMLSLYNHTIANAFHMYRAASMRKGHEAPTAVEAISLDGIVDFFGGYFVHPEYLSTDEAHEFARQACAEWPAPVEVQYPQFLELLCRASHLVHIKLLNEEHGHIRRHIQVARLEHSLKLLLDHMQFDPHVAVIHPIDKPPTPSPSRLELLIQDIQKSLTSLSQRTLDVLEAQVARMRVEGSPASRHDVVVIHDVLAVPTFAPDVQRKVTVALEYQNSGQFHMARAMLADAEEELVGASRFRVLDAEAQLYFTLCKGALHDGERQDAEALAQYTEALGIVDGLPPAHPGRAVVWSCLGAACYYGGATLVALKCFDRALALREEALGATHVDTATSVNNVGCCFYTMGTVSHAGMYFQAALRVLRSCLPLAHPRVAVVRRNLDTARRHQSTYVCGGGGGITVVGFSMTWGTFKRAKISSTSSQVRPMGARVSFRRLGSKFQIEALERVTELKLPAKKTKKKKT
ncbi:hypothetical protein ACHHYP_08600 [Achlya hypogyna]|uniref:Uncharacterized protein n=1 Tax=Achlya hypogyna TaxID=1202772 RepID=A0A1V9ZKJ3_ACHHY|nr:hypothetical protein ACHHYP_08600 [Achlya hypogyna]